MSDRRIGLQLSDNRLRVSRLVLDSPGIHLRELQRNLGLSFSTVRYHIDGLVSEGELEGERMGRYTRLFPRSMPPEERTACSLLREPSARAVVFELARTRVYSNKRISEATGLGKSTVSRQGKRLLRLGVIERTVTPAGKVESRLGNSAVAAAVMRFSQEGRTAVKNYIELWDF